MKSRNFAHPNHSTAIFNHHHRSMLLSQNIRMVAIIVLLVFPFAAISQSEITGSVRSDIMEKPACIKLCRV